MVRSSSRWSAHRVASIVWRPGRRPEWVNLTQLRWRRWHGPMVEGGDGSGGNEAIAAARRRWLDDLVAALPAFEVFGRAMVVIDLGDESIIGATASARALIDGPLPATAADLVEIGLVARPDLGRVRDHIVAWRKLDDLEHTAQESSHGWTDTIRLHRRGAPAVMAKLEITVHRRIDLGADAVVLTLWTDQDEPEPISSDQVEGFEEIWSLYDLDDRMVARCRRRWRSTASIRPRGSARWAGSTCTPKTCRTRLPP